MYCSVCGKEILDEAVICPNCGCMVKKDAQFTPLNKQEVTKKTHASVVLGIVGIVFAWIFALVGHITSIIGIVLGVKEYKENEKITGLALSIVGEVCSIFSSIIGAVISANMF